MPIYAYACRACGEEFQTLVRSGEEPACPHCASVDLDQQLSLIASPSKGAEGAGEPACGPQGCGMCPAMAGAMGCG